MTDTGTQSYPDLRALAADMVLRATKGWVRTRSGCAWINYATVRTHDGNPVLELVIQTGWPGQSGARGVVMAPSGWLFTAVAAPTAALCRTQVEHAARQTMTDLLRAAWCLGQWLVMGVPT